MKYSTRQPPDGINVAPTNHLVEMLLLGGGLIAAVVLAYWLLGWTADLIVSRASPQTEQRIAKILLPATETLAAGTRAQQQLQRLVDRLAAHAPKLPYHIRVHVACNDAINAMALPGGHIVVFQGLLEHVHSENELAMVLAHEIGHIQLRHHLRGLGRGLVFLTLMAALGIGGGTGAALVSHTGEMVAMHFSRDQEAEADRFGAALVVRTYGHASGITDFFAQLDRERHKPRVLAWFSSHPDTQWRIRQLDRLQRQHHWRTDALTPLPQLITDCPQSN